MTETQLKRAIIDAVNKSGIAKIWNSPAGIARGSGGYVHMAPRGTADLAGYSKHGRAIFLEVKLPGKRPTDSQVAFIADAVRAGCIAGVVTSTGEAIQLITLKCEWAVA